MPDFTTCEFIILIPVVMFPFLLLIWREYQAIRDANNLNANMMNDATRRHDAMMRERSAADPQSAARETQG